MAKLKILDCTLRDGGYYNDWNFEINFVEKLISALNNSGIEIVELGYKSLAKDRFYGLCRYCNDSQLEFLKNYNKTEYSFMVDVKEFLVKENVIDLKSIKRIISPRKKSFFTWCRIATYYETVPQAAELAGILKEMGYKVTFNIMGFSLLSETQIGSAMQKIRQSPIDVIYISDSFGSFLPEDIPKMMEILRKYYDGPLGIHTHDNQGLAFANTIAAIKAKVDYIDASVLGMGRGAGNLKLEQLLLFLYFKHNRQELNPYALLDIIQEYFIPMQANFQWGWDFSYMLSGLKNIHPTYCQKLKSSHQYNITQVANILTAISNKHTVKYNSRELVEGSNKVLNPVCDGEGRGRITIKPYTAKQADSVIIIAGGPQLQLYKDAVRTFVKQKQSLILECNNTGICTDLKRTIVVLNRVRLAELHDVGALESADEVVTGMNKVSKELFANNLKYMKSRLGSGEFKIDKKNITIPSYIVGMFAVGIALLCNPKFIYLAGFEGFTSQAQKDEQKEMQNFWDILLLSQYLRGRKLISILPTNYNLPTQSVYSLID